MVSVLQDLYSVMLIVVYTKLNADTSHYSRMENSVVDMYKL
jgi:hypothetical protein